MGSDWKRFLIVGWLLALHGPVARSQGQSLAFVRSNLSLKLVILYPEPKLAEHGATTNLYIVGNGLGLSWNKPTLLTKDGTAKDTWSILLRFNVTSDGSICTEQCASSDVVPANSNFQYRIMTSNGDDMVGANFGLPLASLSKAESNFPPPLHFSYPYFFTKTGAIKAINVTSADAFIQTRQWNYYLPASFEENPYKKYPTTIAFDIGHTNLPKLQPFVEEEVITKGHAEEMIIIGSEDYRLIPAPILDIDRTELLTPSVGGGFYCKEGTPFDACNNCVKPNLTTLEYYTLMRDKCGVAYKVGGRGDAYVDHVTKEVLPALNKLYANRLLTDRSHLGVQGCSLGGLMACHAAWTRPETFGHAICQCSSFWWPIKSTETLELGYEFINDTLKTRTGLRLPQTIYLDVSGGESDAYIDQFGAALAAFDRIAAASPDSFRPNYNLWLVHAIGQTHCDDSTFGRPWLMMSPINRPGGDPKNPNPPPKIPQWRRRHFG